MPSFPPDVDDNWLLFVSVTPTSSFSCETFFPPFHPLKNLIFTFYCFFELFWISVNFNCWTLCLCNLRETMSRRIRNHFFWIENDYSKKFTSIISLSLSDIITFMPFVSLFFIDYLDCYFLFFPIFSDEKLRNRKIKAHARVQTSETKTTQIRAIPRDITIDKSAMVKW